MGRPLHHEHMDVYHVSYHSNTSLSETTIIDLHALFLTPGVHRLHVPTMDDGRRLMVDFLHSLDYYQRIGYLALDTYPVVLDATMYYDLRILLNQKTLPDETESIQDFFDFDFFIIEYVDHIALCDWFDRLMVMSRSSAVPVILISA